MDRREVVAGSRPEQFAVSGEISPWKYEDFKPFYETAEEYFNP